MIRRVLPCLLLLATAAAAQENPALESAMADSLKTVLAQASAPREQVVTLDRCWARLPQDDAQHKAIYDSAKLPVDFCLRTLSIKIVGDGGTMSAAGAYAPVGATERTAVDAKPQAMSSYKSSDGTRVYAAYLYEASNEHGDTGSVFVEFRADKDGKVVPGSVWATFSVGCPGEECAEGEEPGLRTVVSDWPR